MGVLGVVLVQCFEYDVKVLGRGDCCVKGSKSSTSLAPNMAANSFVFLREKSSFRGSGFSAPAC